VSSSPTSGTAVTCTAVEACCSYSRLHRGLPRRARSYPSDMTDAEWRVTEPMLPAPACTTYWGGGREAYCRRGVVDAIRYLVDNGVKWRALPVDFPPWGAVYRYFRRFETAQAMVNAVDELRRHTAAR